MQATFLHKHLLTHRRNTKIGVRSMDVVIPQITKACLLFPGFSSTHRQCQRMLPPMAQDADNKCHAFETLEITTSGKSEWETRDKICLHCLKPTKTLKRRRKNHKHTACADPTHQQKDVFASHTGDNKTGATGNCVKTKTCKIVSVHVRCRFPDAIKPLSPVFARCIFKLTPYLKRTRHDIGFHGIRFSAQHQLMSSLTRNS